MIQLILRDVKCLRLIQTENVYAGENKISEFSVVLPEKITQYKTAECEIEMRSFVSEDRYISTQIDTSTRNPKVLITSDLTEKAQIVPIMFFITHEGNVIGKTNFEKLNVLESKDGSTPLDPREELDEIIAELREQNAAQAQTISSQATTIEQQTGRITELNSEVADLSADNELLRDTVDTFNKSEPKLETPDIVTPSGETQLITPDTSEGYVGLKSVTVDRVTAAVDPDIQSENIKEGVEILGVEGSYNPFPEQSYGGIYVTGTDNSGNPTKLLITNLKGDNSTFYFPFNVATLKSYVKECVFKDCEKYTDFQESRIFQNSVALEHIEFSGVKTIRDEMCKTTPNLRSILIGSGVETIGPSSLGYTAIEEIHIPSTLYSLLDYCLYYNYSLKKINLPNSITKIGTDIFHGDSKLEFVTIENGFNCNNLNLSVSTLYSHDTILSWFNALADRTGQTAYTLTIGTANLNKMTAEEKAIATNKNWNLV